MKIDNGRRRKYGEERLSERIIFYVTETQKEEMEAASGGDVSAYVRTKVFNENNPITQAQFREMDRSSEMQKALLQFLEMQRQGLINNENGYVISLPEHTKEGIEHLAEDLGYPSAIRMIEALIDRAVIHPEQAKDLLLGDANRILREAQRSVEEAEKKQRKDAG